MSTEKTEVETAETPKVEDLIAEAIGVKPDEDEAPEAEPDGDPEEAATEDEAQEGEEEAAPEAEAIVPDAVESPDEAAVTKELADLGITKADSQTRFRELANEAREGRHYREQYEKQSQIFEHMQRHGITGEQFGAVIGIASDVNSNEPVRLRRAFDTMANELQGLAKRLGIEAPSVDTLAFHPDLKRRVEDGDLDRDTALAWAKDKAAAEFAAKAEGYRATQDNQSRAEDQARNDLTSLGDELAKRDPHYDKVYAVLAPTLRPVLSRLPPSEWVGATVDAYRDLRGQLQAAGQLVAAKPAAPPVRRPDPANAGRPNGAAGGPEPKSGQEAIMKMFGYSES